MQRKHPVGLARTEIKDLLEEKSDPENATDDEDGDYGTATPGVSVVHSGQLKHVSRCIGPAYRVPPKLMPITQHTRHPTLSNIPIQSTRFTRSTTGVP